MEINVKKTSGLININQDVVMKYIKDKTLSVAGIESIGSENVWSRLRGLLHLTPKNIFITQLGTGVIGVEIHVTMKRGVNLREVSHQVQHIIKYSLKEKFGIDVSYVDVVVEGTK